MFFVRRRDLSDQRRNGLAVVKSMPRFWINRAENLRDTDITVPRESGDFMMIEDRLKLSKRLGLHGL
jgi:hypothetical protein